MDKEYIIKLYDIVHDQMFVPNLIVVKDIVPYDVSDIDFNAYETARLLKDSLHIHRFETEHVFCVAINRNNEIIGVLNVAIGSNCQASIYKRTIIIFLVLTGAKSFALYHNHPNDIVKASLEDIQCDTQFCSLAKDLDVEYRGSYIVGLDTCLKIGSELLVDLS